MNYYEELGLDPAASPAAIRQAYKELARVLHPDRQDERARRLAECQMKRLHAMVAVLSDPERRRRYDQELAAARPVELVRVPRSEAPSRPRRVASTAWIAAAAIGMAALAWLWRGDANARAPVPPAGGEAATATAAAAPASPARRPRARPAAVQRRSRERRQARLPQPEAPSPEDPGRPELAVPEFAAAAPIPAIAPPVAPAPAVPFAGAWFYTPPGHRRGGAQLYPPEYIETAIEEQDGVIRGRYRARYTVPDLTLPPEVSFEFEGRGAAPSAELDWTGTAGARGELRLRLTAPNTMELSWWTTELGAAPALASGTAVLVRRR